MTEKQYCWRISYKVVGNKKTEGWLIIKIKPFFYFFFSWTFSVQWKICLFLYCQIIQKNKKRNIFPSSRIKKKRKNKKKYENRKGNLPREKAKVKERIARQLTMKRVKARRIHQRLFSVKEEPSIFCFPLYFEKSIGRTEKVVLMSQANPC